MSDRYIRQSFLGQDSERILRSLTVAIVGLGGGGSHIGQQLAHVGVGRFLLFDPQCIEDSNLNRLVGGTSRDVRRQTSKTAIARRLIKAVNPAAVVTQVKSDWKNQATLLRAADIIVGCVDTYRDRGELETQARRYLIPYVDIGMDVHAGGDGAYLVAGQVILSMPGGPCFRCVGFLREDLLEREAAQYGAAGARPQVVWANGVLASIATGLVVQLFCPWHVGTERIVYLEYDGNGQQIRPSRRLEYVRPTCPHFGADDLGDPWFRVPHKKLAPRT